LENLKWVNLENNEIEVISPTIVTLRNLKRLWLYNNKIEVIPEFITEMQNREVNIII